MRAHQQHGGGMSQEEARGPGLCPQAAAGRLKLKLSNKNLPHGNLKKGVGDFFQSCQPIIWGPFLFSCSIK